VTGAASSLTRAEAALEVRRPAEARRLLEPVIAADPGDARALLLLARAWHQEGDLPKVHDLTRRAAAASPDDVDILVGCAALARQAEDRDAALHWAARAASIAPDSLPVLNVLSLVLAQSGRGAEAVVYAEAALQRRPDDPDLLVAHGLALEATGRLGDATAEYVAALRVAPHHQYALNNLAVARLICGDLHRASALLGRALAEDPHLKLARGNVDVLGMLARRVLMSRLGLALVLAFGGAYLRLPATWLIAALGLLWAVVGLVRLPAPVRARLGRDAGWRDVVIGLVILATIPIGFGLADPHGVPPTAMAWVAIFALSVMVPLAWNRLRVMIRLRQLGVRLSGA
jgi:tetratricopeptide (TPR) repeat protein